ncbi:MAG: hypothetical protein DHS20C04_32430 [Hyphococcus sp.]|nr:MAG: hypothetical protein DHS20C04_32430 [Marinicaulis sp.]
MYSYICILPVQCTQKYTHTITHCTAKHVAFVICNPSVVGGAKISQSKMV